MHRFLGCDNPETFFPTRDRQRVAYEILAKTVYGKKKRAEIGIDRLIEEEVYSAAFPLHDVSILAARFHYFSLMNFNEYTVESNKQPPSVSSAVNAV